MSGQPSLIVRADARHNMAVGATVPPLVSTSPGQHHTAAVVGDLIRLAREAEGLRQSELAARLSKTPTAISYWESGKRLPGIDDLFAIAEALGRDAAEFLPPPPQERKP